MSNFRGIDDPATVPLPQPEGPERPSRTPAQPRQNRAHRPYLRSGIHTLRRAVLDLGSRALPSPETPLGRALREWRESLVADLGGADSITTQQLALVDMAVRSKLLVDSVDAYVLGMPSPINKRSRCLYSVVRERQALVSQLQSLLRDLGLERRAKAPLDLSTYLATKGGRDARVPETGGEGSSPPSISFEQSNTDSQEPVAGD